MAQKEFNRLVEFLNAIRAEGLVTRQFRAVPAYFGDHEANTWQAFEPTGEYRGEFSSGWDMDTGPYSYGYLI